MATSSTESGFLVPQESGEPDYDQLFEDRMHDLIFGVLGGRISDDLIRPRFQLDPPNQPEFTENWVAFGVNFRDPDTFAFQRHDPTGDGGNGVNILERHEEVNVLLSFYGPRCDHFCELFRDGVQVWQNRQALRAIDTNLVSVGAPRVIPALLKQKWVRQVDVSLVLRRKITRVYPVRHLLSGHVELNTEDSVTQIDVVPPPTSP